jgi:alcohol dehydrogenase class IV
MAAVAVMQQFGLVRQPNLVLFGPGKRDQIPFVLAKVAKKILITTDARMTATQEFQEIVQAISAKNIEVLVYSDVEPDLPRSNILEAFEKYTQESIDAILGIGGGSCLDMAKVISIVLAHGVDVREFYGEGMVPGPGLPVITVPTTGGTGAEVTCVSVVYDADKGMKIGVASPYLEPYAAIIDPELTLSCPPGLTAATGADALTHLIEAFTSRVKTPTAEQIDRHLYVGKNAFADLFARNGLALLNTSLERVAKDPQDLNARSDTMMGAFNAGMAINTAGTAGAHAIQSPIGGLTHTAHGFGVGALLPYVMRFNLPTRVAEFAEIGRIFGVASVRSDELEQAKSAIRRVEEILVALEAPINLKDLGVQPKDFEFIANQALLATRLTANNPRELTKDSILTILEKGYSDDRSWWEVS